MTPDSYFNNTNTTAQKHYEAMRALHYDNKSLDEVANEFNWSKAYLKKCKSNFSNDLKKGIDPFFTTKKTGPKNRKTNANVIDQIIQLRKQNNAITDIKAILNGQNISISFDTIDKILKSEGFAPLPKRTRQERLNAQLPKKIISPKSKELELTSESFSTEGGAPQSLDQYKSILKSNLS